ncbi:MAG TPA: alpha-amylase family glycosyl hydrolase [Spirochaetota bacterium]|nr:alpha-amylase family glycosyl hydrolase [Spirochaetota bacterium]HOS54452.1 alpha-amylase family glycosyl hydrolase [Spirochaetota bacterium]HQF76945.1 alpha-amylase family glycosyl hydrolase [Spirochaetota bacterium]HQH30416.1 alpha-amylase family glycosyl hydrolase [Spirochaetota bacterium]HQJ04818.1 alpha-amylase family glycosyl hydrolase [Spirochaetota bacterium]
MNFKRNILLILLALLSITLIYPKKNVKPIVIKSAELKSSQIVLANFSGLPQNIKKIVFSIEPKMAIEKIEKKGPYIEIKTKENFDIEKDYYFTFLSKSTKESGKVVIDKSILLQEKFNTIYSDKPLGYFYENGKSIFRYFVPRGKKVVLVIFDKYDDASGKEYEMTNTGDQTFEYSIDGELWGKYYGYKIVERNYAFNPVQPLIDSDIVVSDPYSKAIVQSNVFPQKSRSVIIDTTKFDWQGTNHIDIDIRDAVIMETHLKDISAHASSKSKNPGKYLGMIDAEVGGINYLKKLGVNAVEFLPIQDFCNIEAPFNEVVKNKEGKPYYAKNSWNAYAQNYWGYMTSNFFSPESYYATDGNIDPSKWSGTSGKAVDEFKTLVRELHKNGIAVILDVVYNHVSQYDENSLKYTDYDFYFKKEVNTGCGNEIESRRPMARRLILDSVKYWMTEYKIDGFRFDLAGCHDVETIKLIKEEMLKINPKAFIIAEPWTAGKSVSTKTDFIKNGWSYWNDGIRGTVRGDNRPIKESKSFMLGNAYNAIKLSDYWKGTSGGSSYQSVNYIESHDDTSLGDNIRFSSGEYKITNEKGEINRITDIKQYLKLSPRLMNASKVGALALFLCQGPIMMHLGQEWARGKITPDLTGKVPEVTNKGEFGKSSDNLIYLTPTPNSYSADNDTNFINFDNISLNQELFDYYKGLIQLRKSEKLLGNAKPEEVKILTNDNKNSLGVIIGDKIFGFVNSDVEKSAEYSIPEGAYKVVVDGKTAGIKAIKEISGGNITINPAEGMILIKK